MKKFESIDDVAEATGQHRTTIVRLIAQGKIPAIKLARRVLIPADFLENLAASAHSAVKA